MGHATKTRRNVYAGHRTSMILEDDFWCALEQCAEDMGLAVDSVVSLAHERYPGAGRTAALRIFLISHFRSQTVDD